MKTILAAALLALSASVGSAQTPDVTRMDLRCVLALSALLQNPAYKDGAAAGLFYYVGKIDGRDPAFDLAAGLRREASYMQASDWAKEAQRCGAEVKARNEALKTMSSGAAHRGVGN